MGNLNGQEFTIIFYNELASCVVPGSLHEGEPVWAKDTARLYVGDGSGDPILIGPGTSPGGPAGGQLTGTFPNPVLLYGLLAARPAAPATPGFLYFTTDLVLNGQTGRLQVWRV